MKKILFALLAAMLLTGCAAKTLEIDGVSYPLDAASLILPQGTSAAHYEAVKAALPECEIVWEVPFQGGYLPQDTQSLTLSSLTQEDAAMLCYFPELKTLDATGLSDPAQAHQLALDFPELEVLYNVELCGKLYPSDTRELTFQDPEVSQLENLIYLPLLESVHLTEPTGDAAALKALAEKCPITWEKTVFGQTYSSDVTEIDLSALNLLLDDIPLMKAEMAWFPALELVYYGDVTADNDSMAEYRAEVADQYKVVWNVRLNYRINIRSDATYFMPRKFYMTVIDPDLENLKYFNDMICVDLGHMNIFHCRWVEGMPKLQYLIVADTPIQDIEPLANCKELIYLEIFDTPVTDYTPLLSCTKLRDLNMCWTDGDPAVIAQLTSLERLWWWGTMLTPSLSEEAQQLLVESLPDCEIVFKTTTSTGSGWRKGELYFKMRDILGMEYMD